ncbi:MAG: YkgJ family cysteine cluster protein [Thermodesulfobacteriota bacterium]
MATVQEELISLFTAIDQAFVEVQSQFPEAVKCGRGCDDCCRAVFDVSLVEAVALASVMGSLAEDVRELALIRAAEAAAAWDKLDTGDSTDDLAKGRIRCPLLGEDGLCICYDARPVNCRTYGIPTVIGGAGHACGFSGFESGIDYPTVNLQQLQDILLDLSVRLAGQKEGGRRWPVAKVLLAPDEIFAVLK